MMKKGRWLGCLAASHALLAVAGFAWPSARPLGESTAGRFESPVTDDSREHDRRFAAAVKEFGPDTDFAARMTAGVSSHKRRQSPETTACLTAWLEHDGVMALRWLETDPNYHHFDEILLAHFERHGDEEIARLLNEAPEASSPICGLMGKWMKSHGAADLLRIGGQVKGSEARVNLLRSGFQSKPDEMTRHLPEIRAMLDERAALEFFWFQLSTREIADAAAKAGFPDEAIKQLNKQVQDDEASQTSLTKQLAMSQKNGTAWAVITLQEIRKLHPELEEWTADFAERGLSADELVARLKQAVPELSGRDDEARRLVFAAVFPADAEAATRWLMETRQDWRDILKNTAGSSSNDLRPEEFWRLSVLIDDADGEPILRDWLFNKYGNWLRRDPQGCLIGFDSLAPGIRRDRLIAEAFRSRGSNDKELMAELIRRVEEPALRAKMEESIKEIP